MKGLKAKLITSKVIYKWIVLSNTVYTLKNLRNVLDIRIRELETFSSIDPFKSISIKRKTKIMQKLFKK